MKTYDELLAERDALAAEVEALKNKLEIALAVITCADETGYADDCGFVDVDLVVSEINEALTKTPQQHLAEIRAEAIESAVTYLAESFPDESHESLIYKARYIYISNRYLREYAAKVRQRSDQC